jgi:hypothetical protein
MPIADYLLKRNIKKEEHFNQKLARFWNKYGDVISNLPFIPGTGVLDWVITRKFLGHPSRENTDKILKAHKMMLVNSFNKSIEKGVPDKSYKNAIDNVNRAIKLNKNAPEGRLMQIRPLESNFKPSIYSFQSFDRQKAKHAFKVLAKLERERTGSTSLNKFLKRKVA